MLPPTAHVDHRNDDRYCVIRFSGPVGLEATHVIEGDKHVAHGESVNEKTRLLVEALMNTAGVVEVRVVASELADTSDDPICNIGVYWPEVTSSRSALVATRVTVSQAAWNTVQRLLPEVTLRQAFWKQPQY